MAKKRRLRPAFDADEPYLYLARERQQAQAKRISGYSAALLVIDDDTPRRGQTPHSKAMRLGKKLDENPDMYCRHPAFSAGAGSAAGIGSASAVGRSVAAGRGAAGTGDAIRIAEFWPPEAKEAYARLRAKFRLGP